VRAAPAQARPRSCSAAVRGSGRQRARPCPVEARHGRTAGSCAAQSRWRRWAAAAARRRAARPAAAAAARRRASGPSAASAATGPRACGCVSTRTAACCARTSWARRSWKPRSGRCRDPRATCGGGAGRAPRARCPPMPCMRAGPAGRRAPEHAAQAWRTAELGGGARAVPRGAPAWARCWQGRRPAGAGLWRRRLPRAAQGVGFRRSRAAGSGAWRARTQAANLQGETIYKGHRSYDLMLSLQLGMRHSAGELPSAGAAQRLAPEHFAEKARRRARSECAGTPARRGRGGAGRAPRSHMRCEVAVRRADREAAGAGRGRLCTVAAAHRRVSRRPRRPRGAPQVKLHFPRDGSAATPPHPGADFLWKDYCPHAFRRLRRTFSIDAAQYLQSICGARRPPGAVSTSVMAAAPPPAFPAGVCEPMRAARSAAQGPRPARRAQATKRCASCRRPARAGACSSCRTTTSTSSRPCARRAHAAPPCQRVCTRRSCGRRAAQGAQLPRAGPACPPARRRASGRRLLRGPLASTPWACLPYGFCHARCTFSAGGRGACASAGGRARRARSSCCWSCCRATPRTCSSTRTRCSSSSSASTASRPPTAPRRARGPRPAARSSRGRPAHVLQRTSPKSQPPARLPRSRTAPARARARAHRRRGAQVRFVVMNNLFPTSLPVQRQYDLKGSTLGRTAAGRGPVLKDLDLDVSIRLEDGWHDKRAPAPRAVPAACCCRGRGEPARERLPGAERLAALRAASSRRACGRCGGSAASVAAACASWPRAKAPAPRAQADGAAGGRLRPAGGAARDGLLAAAGRAPPLRRGLHQHGARHRPRARPDPGPPDAACAHGRVRAGAGRPAALSLRARPPPYGRCCWARKAARGLRLRAVAPARRPRAQEDEGEDEADTPLAAGPGGFWAPVGRLSADLRPPARHSSAEGAPGGSPARSPVRGGSAVNDLDAAWARVQARGPAARGRARLGARGARPRTPAQGWRPARVWQDLLVELHRQRLRGRPQARGLRRGVGRAARRRRARRRRRRCASASRRRSARASAIASWAT